MATETSGVSKGVFTKDAFASMDDAQHQFAESANKARKTILFNRWPLLTPTNRPRIGAPARARSPTASKSL